MKLRILLIIIHLLLYTPFFGQNFPQYRAIEEFQVQRTKSAKQNIVRSTDGYLCSPRGTYRGLAIFVNIIYDQAHPDTIRKYSSPATYWKPDTTFSINMYPPAYFTQIFDVMKSANYNGIITKFYAESSFNQLHLLGDMMVVNIRQSQITPDKPASDFTLFNLMDAVAEQINRNGGIKTIYGHNNISDYDISSFAGLDSDRPDGKIDMIHFVLRNTFIRNNIINYGSANPGSGYSGLGVCPRILIKIGNVYCGYNLGSYQCVGGGDITSSSRGIWGHEIAHYFLGGNEFHTSGGNHTGDYTFMPQTFIGTQMGYGLFGGGITSCNGYERWRLGWQNPTNNAYAIAANNLNADIEKFEGEKTFTLRDFVTYGDAIRIKLPYKDNPESSNQYIWLENHQCGKNGKIDDIIYSNPGTCRDVQGAGIYAYYQVGKDILESEHDSIVFPKNEKDNLRMISAEGNFDAIYINKVEDCLRFCGGNCRPQYEYISENVFTGVNDLTEVYPVNLFTDKLQYSSRMQYLGSKIKNNVPQNNLPFIYDDFDAFKPSVSEAVMDVSTNPAAVNTTTYYSIQNTRVGDSLTFKAVDSIRNTRKIYLTGLSIRMIDPNPAEIGMKAYTVKIRWDDYDVKKDVTWKGNIVLKEKLNILEGRTVSLRQSRSANQIYLDSVSGCFSPPTFFTCESGSVLTLFEQSVFELEDKSSLIVADNAKVTIRNGAKLILESGSTLLLKEGANLNIEGEGKLIIKSGAYFCAHPGSIITLPEGSSAIEFDSGALKGANPKIFSETECKL
jgi:hypothetical protein